MCQMLPGKFEMKWNYIGCISFQSVKTSGECFNCFQASNEGPCSVHKDMYQDADEPMLCIIQCETSHRGSFDRFIICSEDINMCPRRSYAANVFHFNYIPHGVKSNIDRTNDNSIKKLVGKKLLQKANSSLSVAEKVLQQFVQENWRDTTLIAYGRDDLSHLLKAILNSNLTPHLLKRGRNIISLRIKELNLRFINLQNFVDCQHLHNYIDMFGLSLTPYYFPSSLCPKNAARFDGIPGLEYFFNFLDSEDILQRKRHFWTNMKNSDVKWEYNDQLILKGINDCQIITDTVCRIMKEAFQIQEMMEPKMQRDEKFLPFIHPFSSSMSGPNYVFRVFKIYGYDMSKLRAVKAEFSGQKTHNTSIPEFQWLSWLQSQHIEEIRTAFNNPDGQRFIKDIGYPDGCAVLGPDGKRVAFEFLGCYHHGHWSVTCRYTSGKDWNAKTAKTKSLTEKMEDTRNRIIALANHPSFDEVRYIFQCHWEEEIQRNEDLKKFISNLQPHPRKRLIPRVRVYIKHLSI